MSIFIEINSRLSSSDPLQIHYLPAKIDGDGSTDVEKNFNVYTRKAEGGFLTNALRGYPLKGEDLLVPAGYKAIVIQETQKPLDEKADRRLRVMGHFENFHYWNYDKIPTKADPYRQALQTLDIAKELATSVSQSEVEAEMARQKQYLTAKENE